MNWTVLFYETDRGEKPVKQFIFSQQKQAQSKILHLLELLQQYGNILGMPHSKRLGNNLFELRIRGKEEIRLLYCFRKSNIIILHAFKKQTQKTPRKEIETALKRMQTLT